MRKNKTTLDDRQEVQKKEGYDTVSSDVPGDRIQDNKQVLTPEQLGVDVPTKDKAFTTAPGAATKLKDSISIKPSASVKELEGKQIGGVPLGGEMYVASAAGAGSESMVNDRSRTPYNAGGYRPDARFGRKIADKTFVINNAISEQIDPEFEESKALYEDPSAVQGYIGRKKFNVSRGKKNVGTRPQDLLYFRSVDFINHDESIFSTGQIVGNVSPEADYPTITVAASDSKYSKEQRNAEYTYVNNALRKGNYTPKTFCFDLVNGRIANPCIKEVGYKIPMSRNASDVANVNWQVDANNVANSMIKLQKELGRETTDKWSPLGYVIRQGYEVNMLMHDIEATTGAYAAAAYRAATASMAHQLNMIAKEGASPDTPAYRMVLKGMGKVADDSIFNSDVGLTMQTLFSTPFTKKGAVTAIIKMFDSTNKYKTKADLLTAQRSLKYMLSVADNNIDPFYVKPEFMKALNVAHTYSTMDGSYNPALPIYNTEWIEVTNPLSLNYFLENWEHPKSENFDPSNHDSLSGCYNGYVYSYSDLRNQITTPIHHPLIDGVMKWLLDHEAGLCAAYYEDARKSTSDTIHIEMPMAFNVSNPTMWAWIVCAAMQDIAYMRNNYLRDVLFAGEQMEYIWNDLRSLKDVNPLWSTQLTIGRYDEPLKLGTLSTAGKIRCAIPEHFMIHNEAVGEGGFYIMPWYMNENQFDPESDDFYAISDNVTSSCMTMPSIRCGVRHEYIDLLYSISERDVRLCLDRLVAVPHGNVDIQEYRQFDGEDAREYVPVLGTCTNVSFDDGVKGIYAIRYDNNSDGRVGVNYKKNLTHASIMCTPRELGYLTRFDTSALPIFGFEDGKLKYDYDKDIRATYDTELGSGDNGHNKEYKYIIDTDISGDSAWSIVSYAASPVTSANVTSRQLQTTAALKQIAYTFWAMRSPTFMLSNTAYVEATGFAPCFSAALSAGNDTINKELTVCDAIAPINGVVGDVSGGNTNKFFTLASVLYPLMQRLFFVTNPFENALIEDDSSSGESGVYTDPMEVSFLFGVGGFLASDFSEDVNQRLDDITQLGFAYTEDNFIKSSLIFRE